MPTRSGKKYSKSDNSGTSMDENKAPDAGDAAASNNPNQGSDETTQLRADLTQLQTDLGAKIDALTALVAALTKSSQAANPPNPSPAASTGSSSGPSGQQAGNAQVSPAQPQQQQQPDQKHAQNVPQTASTRTRTMKDITIPRNLRFTGTHKPEELETFLSSFVTVVCPDKITAETFRQCVIATVTPEVLTTLSKAGPMPSNMTELRTALFNQYIGLDEYEVALKKYRKHDMNKKERLADYIRRKEKEAETLKAHGQSIATRTLISDIIRAAPRDISGQLIQANIQTIDELKQIATRIDVQTELKKSQQTDDDTVLYGRGATNRPRKFGGLCHWCNIVGHKQVE